MTQRKSSFGALSKGAKIGILAVIAIFIIVGGVLIYYYAIDSTPSATPKPTLAKSKPTLAKSITTAANSITTAAKTIVTTAKALVTPGPTTKALTKAQIKPINVKIFPKGGAGKISVSSPKSSVNENWDFPATNHNTIPYKITDSIEIKYTPKNVTSVVQPHVYTYEQLSTLARGGDVLCIDIDFRIVNVGQTVQNITTIRGTNTC